MPGYRGMRRDKLGGPDRDIRGNDSPRTVEETRENRVSKQGRRISVLRSVLWEIRSLTSSHTEATYRTTLEHIHHLIDTELQKDDYTMTLKIGSCKEGADPLTGEGWLHAQPERCYFYPGRDCPGWSHGGTCSRILQKITPENPGNPLT
jgi:hypothetical protein